MSTIFSQQILNGRLSQVVIDGAKKSFQWWIQIITNNNL